MTPSDIGPNDRSDAAGGRPADPTDEILHARILREDPAALSAWQERYRGRVQAMALRMGLSAEDAEEVWEDAFFSALRAIGRIEPLGSGLRLYLFGAARRRAAEVLRRRSRGPQTLNFADLGILATPPQAPTVSDPPAPRVARLRDCIDRAPERHRIVASALLASASAPEIAGVLGIQKRSAYVIIKRTLAWLAGCIDQGDA